MTLREANEFVTNFHRHNKKTQGCKFCIGASDGQRLVGVAIVGRPIARAWDNGVTAEVTRVCSHPDAPKNTGSFLYGRCWRIWQQMGGKKMLTYTLKEESGATMRAVGWKIMGETKPATEKGGWNTRAPQHNGYISNREWQPVMGQLKLRGEIAAATPDNNDTIVSETEVENERV